MFYLTGHLFKFLRAAVFLSVVMVLSVSASTENRDTEADKLVILTDRTSYVGGEILQIAIQLDVGENWSILGEDTQLEDLQQLTLDVKLPDRVKLVSKTFMNKIQLRVQATEKLQTYKSKALIILKARIGDNIARGAAQLEAIVNFQKCNEERCLVPRERKKIAIVNLGVAGQPINIKLFSPQSVLQGRFSLGIVMLFLIVLYTLAHIIRRRGLN